MLRRGKGVVFAGFDGNSYVPSTWAVERRQVFQRVTDGVRRVLILAEGEARRLGSDRVSTEHVLIGLLLEGQGVAAKALESLGASLAAVRTKVDQLTGSPAGNAELARLPHGAGLPFTAGATRLLERAGFEAFQRAHNHLDTEHLLFAVLADDDDVAIHALVGVGVDVTAASERVMEFLGVGADAAS